MEGLSWSLLAEGHFEELVGICTWIKSFVLLEKLLEDDSGEFGIG